MAKGTVNKVILIGNLGRDPEVRYTPNGLAVANLALATTESWKDKQSGENQERTEWHRVSCYGRTAEIAGEYLHKGSKIFIEGRLQTKKWQDKNTNQDRYTTEIVVDSLQMLDGKGGSNAGNASQQSYNEAGSNSYSSAPEKSAAGGMEASHAQPVAAEQFDDDIPF